MNIEFGKSMSMASTSSSSQNGSNGSSALPLDGTVVKMKGLPFKAAAEDIIKFFSGYTLKPENVYLKRHPDGRPNGEVRRFLYMRLGRHAQFTLPNIVASYLRLRSYDLPSRSCPPEGLGFRSLVFRARSAGFIPLA